MYKSLVLIKTCMSDNMSLFKIKTKSQNQKTKKILPLFLAGILFFTIYSYAYTILEQLTKVKLEIVVLTLFVILTFIMTLVEGIYKSSSLLFNCKDDDLLLSLPIERKTVLFIRVFKFYVFELLYNSLLLVPAMIAYTMFVKVDPIYYLISAIMVVLLPILPIVISSFIGAFIASTSTKFKYKNIAQTIITMILLLGIMYISFNVKQLINDLAKSASSINDLITKLYYPAGIYNKLITDFNLLDLLVFVVINIGLFGILIFSLSKIYFKINSKVKSISVIKTKKHYKIKEHKVIPSLIKKELKRFISSPVFVTNAAFGLVLFIVGAVGICLKYDTVTDTLIKQGIFTDKAQIKSYIPVVTFGFICIASLMSSITSSMVSLEGKSITILKSLPIKPITIILSKVYTAVLIMLPFILIGDLILFIKFKFSIYEILIILLVSIILPLIAEIIGIIVNLKYPNMDAESDTEVVKQSMSSTIAVFIGMIYTSLTCYFLFLGVKYNAPVDSLLIITLLINMIILIILITYLSVFGKKDFNKITV